MSRAPGRRGSYKKRIAPMPLLLRRALAQLRNKDPATWPDSEGHSWTSHYPIPSWLNHLGLMEKRARQTAFSELENMLERLERADLGSTWAAVKRWGIGDGSAVLLVMIRALLPIRSKSASEIHTLLRDAKTAVDQLADSLTALQQNGFNVAALLTPPDAKTLRAYPEGHTRGYVADALTDPGNLLVTLRHMGGMLPGAKIPQRRGTLAKRRAAIIARELAALGAKHASRLASAATGASITPRAVTKIRNQFARKTCK